MGDLIDTEAAEQKRLFEDAPRRARNSVRMMRSQFVRQAKHDEEAIESLIWIRDHAIHDLIQEAATEMLENGWSQSDMARLLGVSRQAIHKRFT